jgi:hypothetical protein
MVRLNRGRYFSITMLCTIGLFFCTACSYRQDGLARPAGKNSLSQHTGNPGSTIPKAHPPYYPNTAGNIVAPPGNPGGNPPGSPPIVGGNMAQQSEWR